jgi:hypothetical protein
MINKNLDADPAPLAAGRFDGYYFDVFGHRADVKLEVWQSISGYEGQCELRLHDTDMPVVLRGPADGLTSANVELFGTETPAPVTTLTFHLARVASGYEENGDISIPVGNARSVVFVASASSFARKAIFGVMSPDAVNRLGGGIWIAWEFKGTEA